jgi:hypothetical protein
MSAGTYEAMPPSAKQSERWWRAIDRQYRAAKRARGMAADDDEPCSICHAPLDDGSLVTVTTCGHSYHEACWSAFVLSKTPRASAGMGTAHLLAAAYINAFAGPPCPLCRTQFPTIHTMALRLADRKSAKVDRDVARVDVDTSLFMASRAW